MPANPEEWILMKQDEIISASQFAKRETKRLRSLMACFIPLGFQAPLIYSNSLIAKHHCRRTLDYNTRSTAFCLCLFFKRSWKPSPVDPVTIVCHWVGFSTTPLGRATASGGRRAASNRTTWHHSKDNPDIFVVNRERSSIWGGWSSQIEVTQVLGMYIHKLYTLHVYYIHIYIYIHICTWMGHFHGL